MENGINYYFTASALARQIRHALQHGGENGARMVREALDKVRAASPSGQPVVIRARDLVPAGVFDGVNDISGEGAAARPAFDSVAALRREFEAAINGGAPLSVRVLYHWMAKVNEKTGALEIPEKMRGARRVVAIHSAFLDVEMNGEAGKTSRLDFRAADIQVLNKDAQGRRYFALVYDPRQERRGGNTDQRPEIVAVYVLES